jgi:copper chaperone
MEPTIAYPHAVFDFDTPMRYNGAMNTTYEVPGMTCEHCRVAVTEEVTQVAGVESVDVDLETKLVVVAGEGVSDEAVREAIREAGYEAA